MTDQTTEPSWRLALLDILAAPAIGWLWLVSRCVRGGEFSLTLEADTDE